MLRVDEIKCRHESLAAQHEVTTSDTITVNTRCEKERQSIQKVIDNYHFKRLSPKRRRHLVKSFKCQQLNGFITAEIWGIYFVCRHVMHVIRAVCSGCLDRAVFRGE